MTPVHRALFIVFLTASAIPALGQQPWSVWQDPDLATLIREPGSSALFQGRVFLRKDLPRADVPEFASAPVASTLWATDGTAAGTELVHPGPVVGNPVTLGDQLFFLVGNGREGTSLLAYDGRVFESLAEIPVCGKAWRIQVFEPYLVLAQENTTFSNYQEVAVFRYHLETEAVTREAHDGTEMETNGEILITRRYSHNPFQVLRFDDRGDFARTIPASAYPTFWRGLLYWLGSGFPEDLAATDGTEAGTLRFARSEDHPIAEVKTILGSNSAFLFLGAVLRDAVTPDLPLYLATADGTVDGFRLIRPDNPIQVKTTAGMLATTDGHGVYFQGADNRTYYSNGLDLHTEALISWPTATEVVLRQVDRDGDRDLLLFETNQFGRRICVLYTSDGRAANTEQRFADPERQVTQIHGDLGESWLVAYKMPSDDPDGFIYRFGRLNLADGTLTDSGAHADLVGPGFTFQTFGDDGVRFAFTTKDEFWENDGHLFLYDRTTRQTRHLGRHQDPWAAADGEALFVGYREADRNQVFQWDAAASTLRLVTTLPEEANFQPTRVQVLRLGAQTAIATGANLYRYDPATRELTKPYGDALSTIGQAVPGRRMVVGYDALRFFDFLAPYTIDQVSFEGFIDAVAVGPQHVYVSYDLNSSWFLQRVDLANLAVDQVVSVPENEETVRLAVSPNRAVVQTIHGDSDASRLYGVDLQTGTAVKIADLEVVCETDERFLIWVGGRFLFPKYTAEHGFALWTTDGTLSGTRLLADLTPDRVGGFPRDPLVLGDDFYFRSWTPEDGERLWHLAAASQSPQPIDDPAGLGRRAPRLLSGHAGELIMTRTDRDLWHYQPAYPITLAAPASVCNNGETVTLRVDAVHPDSSFHWQLTDATLVSGQGTAEVTLIPTGEFSFGAQVMVTLGETTRSESVQIPVRAAAPTMPTTITGRTLACPLEQGVTYSVAPVAGAAAYEWAVPAGSVIQSGQGTAQVVLAFGEQSGEVRVRAVNACGGSDWQLLAVTLDGDGIVADAGADRVTCDAALQLDAVLPKGMSGTWTLDEPGAAELSDASDPRATLTFIQSGQVTLTWTLSAGSCPSAADQVTLTHYNSFETANAGEDQEVCSSDTVRLTGNMPDWATELRWEIVAGVGGRIYEPNAVSTLFEGIPGEPYRLRLRLSGAPCGDSEDTVRIVFRNSREIEPPPHQCAVLGDTLSLQATAVGAGYWDILVGPDSDPRQILDSELPVTGFRPNKVGEYHLRWNNVLGGCEAKRVLMVVTVTEAAPPAPTVVAYPSLEGALPAQFYVEGVPVAAGLLLGVNENEAYGRDLVLVDETETRRVFVGDACSAAVLPIDGDTYVAATTSRGTLNLWRQSAGHDEYRFVTGYEGEGTVSVSRCGTVGSQALSFDGALYFLIGGSLFRFDLQTEVLESVLYVGTSRGECFVWNGALYAAGTSLWRRDPGAVFFERVWAKTDRSEIQTPVARATHQLFFRTVKPPRANFGYIGMWASDGTAAGTVDLAGLQRTLFERNPGLPIVAGDKVVFHADSEKEGREPWVSDGTEFGTRPLTDLDPGPDSTAGSQVKAFSLGGFAFFLRDGRLWRSDGTREGTHVFADLVDVRWMRAWEGDALVWTGRRLVRFSPTQIGLTELFALNFTDEFPVTPLGFGNNRFHIQLQEPGGTRILAVGLAGGAVQEIEQRHRRPRFDQSFIARLGERLLLLGNETAPVLRALMPNGQSETLLTLAEGESLNDVTRIGNTLFFTLGAERRLYRTDGSLAGTLPVGIPQHRYLDSPTATERGLLYFAADGQGTRVPFFADLAGVARRLGEGVQLQSPRHGESAGGIHRLGNGSLLLFLETAPGAVGLWRFDAAGSTLIRHGVYTHDPETGLQAVAEGQVTQLVFHLADVVYTFDDLAETTTATAQGNLRYQGTLQGDPVFLVDARVVASVDASGSWRVHHSLDADVERVIARIHDFFLLVMRERDHQDFARWVGPWFYGDDAFQNTLLQNLVLIAPLGNFLIFQDSISGALEGLRFGQGDKDTVAGRRFFGGTERPFVITGDAVYAVDQPDKQQFGIWRFNGPDYETVNGNFSRLVLDLFPGSGSSSVSWMRRLGNGVLVCGKTAGEGEVLWRLNGYCAERIAANHANPGRFSVLQADEDQVIVADQGDPTQTTVMTFSATTPPTIPDATLRAALIARFDSDQNQVLDASERAAVTELDIQGLGIQSLAGIALFPNLSRLNAKDNMITDLTPLLRHPNLGDAAEHEVDVRENPLSWHHCRVMISLEERFSASGAGLELYLVKATGLPPRSSWPERNVLELLRPGFYPGYWPGFDRCR
ncbi:hypothetical protein [Acanthopleuribacter pedis]|uniref:PKD-like domain-containing protein n=1 Tax=Acanthopleuribacter pedis TaxID=442870 RepID=A0A8J7Q7H5_9BACT|nr:hypothetical protein [Acanthopleuribacter pedis]MBO1322117.1 hypothetical protein [Acanthopleuribacter pedis]